ncbi:MAG: lysophospholipid acyltransferase family protein [Chitinophagaceae bacterium]
MEFLVRVFRFIYSLYALLVFVFLMIPVFLFSVVASLFGNIKGGNLIYKACMVWGDVWFALVFINHKNIYEQKPAKDASYIFLANHISFLDTPIIVKTFRRTIRPLAKIEMAKVPVFGFIYKKAVVTVDRSNAKNRSKSIQVLKAILRKGISILVFPEGTFNQTNQPLKEFYHGAFRIAIETGTPIMPVLILDSYDRMNYKSIFSLNPGRSRSVFLKEIKTEGYTTHDISLLQETVFSVMEEKLRFYRASWIKEVHN